MGRHLSTWRYLTALGAAYLLVVQLLVTGVFAGAQVQLDGTAHDFTLCAPSGASADTGTPGDPAPKLPPCCMVGCTMLGWAGLLPPPTTRFSPLVYSLVRPLPPPALVGAVRRDVASSFDARGPPLSA